MLKYHEVPTPLKRAALDHPAQLPGRQSHLLRHDVAQHPLHCPSLSRMFDLLRFFTTSREHVTVGYTLPATHLATPPVSANFPGCRKT